VAMYSIERLVWEAAGQPVPASLPSPDEVVQLRRLALSSPSYLYPGVPREVREKALACSVTRCATLMEAIGFSATVRNAGPEANEALEWLLAQQPCDPALANKISVGPPASLEDLSQVAQEPSGIDRLFPPDAG
jgi:uncharacterized protein YcbX